jgi:hypothetical protein
MPHNLVEHPATQLHPAFPDSANNSAAIIEVPRNAVAPPTPGNDAALTAQPGADVSASNPNGSADTEPRSAALSLDVLDGSVPAAPAPLPPPPNSTAMLDEHARRAKDALQRGNTAGGEALEAFRDADREIGEMKKILPHGEFGRQVEQRCECSLQWARRLMKLFKVWNDYTAALTWKESTTGQPRRHRSVEGALSLVVEWKSAKAGTPKKKSYAERLKGRLDIADGKLAAASALNCKLMGDNKLLRTKLSELKAAPPIGAYRHIEETDRQQIDEFAELWLHGTSEEERLSAITKLEKFARDCGRHLDALVIEMGLETKAGFRFLSMH